MPKTLLELFAGWYVNDESKTLELLQRARLLKVNACSNFKNVAHLKNVAPFRN